MPSDDPKNISSDQKRQQAFEKFLQTIKQITPVTPLVSSTEAVRKTREADADINHARLAALRKAVAPAWEQAERGECIPFDLEAMLNELDQALTEGEQSGEAQPFDPEIFLKKMPNNNSC